MAVQAYSPLLTPEMLFRITLFILLNENISDLSFRDSFHQTFMNEGQSVLFQR